MKKIIALLLSCYLSNQLFAQDLDPIQIDRPDQTECSFIVPKNYIQVENGFSYEQVNDSVNTLVTPSSLWKFGINERFELRLITEYNTVKFGDSQLTGLNPITFGFKSNLVKEKGIIPMISFIGHLTSNNWGSSEFSTTFYSPSFRFTLQHTLNENISLGYNLGAEWDGETAEPIFLYILTTGFSLGEKIGAYIEVYGFAPQNSRANHRADGGFTYLVNSNIILDLSGGMKITDNAPDWYGALGVSFRFNTKK